MSAIKQLSKEEIAARIGDDPVLKIFVSPLPALVLKGKGNVGEYVERFAQGLSKLKKVSTIQFTAGSKNDTRCWHIVLGPESKVIEGTYERPDLEIIAPEGVLLRLLSGEVSPLEVFGGGKLRVRGDIRLASLAARALHRQ